MGDKSILHNASFYIKNGEFEKAEKMLVPLLSSGDAEAEFLFSTFSAGHETEEEFEERRLALIRSSAEKNYPAALYTLGYFYDVGELVTKDKRIAMKMFQKAAELGHAHSQYIIALDMLDRSNGDFRGIDNGLTMLKKAATGKFEGAIVLLAEIYEKGLYGLAIDKVESERILGKLRDPDLVTW